MAEWNPREEMGVLSYYLKFKLRRWTEVESLPEWVSDSMPTYTRGRILKFEGPNNPIHQRQVWEGNDMKYMIRWEATDQHDIDIVGMYAKIQ